MIFNGPNSSTHTQDLMSLIRTFNNCMIMISIINWTQRLNYSQRALIKAIYISFGFYLDSCQSRSV